MKKSVYCVAFVNDSILAATILKGILMISPLEIPTKVFSNVPDAMNWVQSMITQ